MSTAYIQEWVSFTDTAAPIAGTTLNYGGADDWLKYWVKDSNGGTDFGNIMITYRLAPGLNWTQQVSKTIANDNSLLKQDLGTLQPLVVPGTVKNAAAATIPTYTYSTYGWNGTYSAGEEEF